MSSPKCEPAVFVVFGVPKLGVVYILDFANFCRFLHRFHANSFIAASQGCLYFGIAHGFATGCSYLRGFSIGMGSTLHTPTPCCEGLGPHLELILCGGVLRIISHFCAFLHFFFRGRGSAFPPPVFGTVTENPKCTTEWQSEQGPNGPGAT